MKSIRNHLSLVVALLSILFSIQIFMVVDRSIEAYNKNLASNYSIIIVSQKTLSDADILKINKTITSSEELSPDDVIKRLNSGIKSKNIELLKLTLPKFYKLILSHYPSTEEVKKLTNDLLKNSSIIKVENFSYSHDSTYKLLLLFKYVVSIFAIVVLVVTLLLIFKELKIWQYKHNERMNIMGLFGAALWLRSMVLFRLAVVDALLASTISLGVFLYLSNSWWVLDQFKNIGIEVVVFNPLEDSLIMLGVSVSISIILASLIVFGHKEEV